MNKYYKLTNLLILILLILGAFFFWKEQTSSPNLELKIVATTGKADQLQDIEFYGHLSKPDVYGNYSTFHFKNNQANYLDNQSLKKRLDNPIEPLTYDLVSDHRSFMRGKIPAADHYISTSDWLIYVGMNNDVYWKDEMRDQLTIASLNKKTGTENEFSISLDNEANFFNLYTSHFNYPELFIMLAAHYPNGEIEHVMYSFDIENPNSELTPQLDFTEQIDKGENIQIGKVFDKSSRFIPFQTTKYIENTQVEDTNELTGYYVYDIEQNKIIEVPLFETNTLLLTDRNAVYVAEKIENQLDVYEMDPVTEELTSLGEIPLSVSNITQDDVYYYDGFFNHNIGVLDGKLYAFDHQEVNSSYLPVFQITDLKNQDTLFLGTIDRLEATPQNPINIEVLNFRLNPSLNE